uniref:Uncharacterized protein n=1 Tax=Panagrolaimus davidi TaxID=227884 RepID=A0A914PH68_9BILA
MEKCSLIEKCIGEEFTDIREDLSHFDKAFDRAKAVEDGQIVPRRGIDKDYDTSLKKVAACEKACNEYLENVKRELKISVSFLVVYIFIFYNI